MPYWKITPHQDSDYDYCVMPAETEGDHQSALKYAQDRLEEAWDSTSHEDGPKSVTVEICEGEIPSFDDEA